MMISRFRTFPCASFTNNGSSLSSPSSSSSRSFAAAAAASASAASSLANSSLTARLRKRAFFPLVAALTGPTAPLAGVPLRLFFSLGTTPAPVPRPAPPARSRSAVWICLSVRLTGRCAARRCVHVALLNGNGMWAKFRCSVADDVFGPRVLVYAREEERAGRGGGDRRVQVEASRRRRGDRRRRGWRGHRTRTTCVPFSVWAYGGGRESARTTALERAALAWLLLPVVARCVVRVAAGGWMNRPRQADSRCAEAKRQQERSPGPG